jgi:hypothetical protein
MLSAPCALSSEPQNANRVPFHRDELDEVKRKTVILIRTFSFLLFPFSFLSFIL